jgi:HAD superfamily hydrolase (TIGR01549 family)
MTRTNASHAEAHGRRNILLDLDDTLYVCKVCEEAGLRAVTSLASSVLNRTPEELVKEWKKARRAVKDRIDGCGSSHSRLLYISELVHALGRPDALPHVRKWDRAFWDAFIEAAKLRPRVVPFFEAVRAAGGKIAIVSDLTLEVQLMKLERFGVMPMVDAIVTSEEVESDKPKKPIFKVGIARLGTTADKCIIVGDNEDKDGEGARRMGIPFFKIEESDERGEGFDAVLRAMGIEPR